MARRRYYRRRPDQGIELALGLFTVVGLAGWGLWKTLGLYVRAEFFIYSFLVLAAFGLAILCLSKIMTIDEQAKWRALAASQIDKMDGHQFEYYSAELLKHQGYKHVRVTKASGDYGVDVLANKDRVSWAVQAKRFVGSVDQKAIREVYAGCAHYKCQRGMVITTSYFTPGAKQLARSTNVKLIDRDTLARWILAFQRNP